MKSMPRVLWSVVLLGTSIGSLMPVLSRCPPGSPNLGFQNTPNTFYADCECDCHTSVDCDNWCGAGPPANYCVVFHCTLVSGCFGGDNPAAHANCVFGGSIYDNDCC